MKNPNKPIRTAYITAFSALGVPVWAKKVPKGVTIPQVYVLLHSQTKNTTAEDKDSFEWLCTMVVDIVSRREAGYSKPEILDDLEEQINEIIFEEIPIPYFINKETSLVDSRDIDTETTTHSIERRLITFQHWVNNVD